MAATLSAREYQILVAVIQEMGEIPAVDFNKVANATGQKYARNARSAFKKVWEKLKACEAGEGGQAGGSGDDDAKVEGPKMKSKVTPKKGVGQRKTPVTGAARKTQKRSKKEEEARTKAEALNKTETEGENDADGELDVTGGNEDDGDFDSGFKSDGDDGLASHADSHRAYKENEDEDDKGAAMLGISVEEFRSVADSLYQTNYNPPTPKGYIDIEDEA